MTTQILILLKYFNRLLIKNPLTIIHDRIIQEAKRLFIDTNERSKTIAYEPGFENEAYFNRFFKSQSENSLKKCASKSMICAFFRQWNTLL